MKICIFLAPAQTKLMQPIFNAKPVKEQLAKKYRSGGHTGPMRVMTQPKILSAVPNLEAPKPIEPKFLRNFGGALKNCARSLCWRPTYPELLCTHLVMDKP